MHTNTNIQHHLKFFSMKMSEKRLNIKFACRRGLIFNIQTLH